MLPRPLALFVTLLLAHATAAGSPPEHVFSRLFGDSWDQQALSSTVDPLGNIIVTGYFEGTMDFGGRPLVASGPWNMFIVKFDASGNHLWSMSFASTGTRFPPVVFGASLATNS